MKVAAKEYVLKTGEKVLIREGMVTDSEALMETVREYVVTSRYLIVAPNELENTVADEEKWIRELRQNPNSLLLLALHKGQVIGNLDLTGSGEEYEDQSGLITMGILQEYQNKGLGSIMLREALAWARQNHQLQVLCLQVKRANKSAVRLYQKAGFQVEGKQPDLAPEEQVDYSESIIMTLNL
ncbi:GNAT family N-acetyltransferase [Pontibacter pamirensis]|uniref:GNAT family N-acetyltransferase n=1 Tax=Pontibacter pamirensis TaxID=2562824 RepID=UPI001389CDA9|nr:GNAT family N-acetyltransferase [Pontibacter pamirensis]